MQLPHPDWTRLTPLDGRKYLKCTRYPSSHTLWCYLKQVYGLWFNRHSDGGNDGTTGTKTDLVDPPNHHTT